MQLSAIIACNKFRMCVPSHWSEPGSGSVTMPGYVSHEVKRLTREAQVPEINLSRVKEFVIAREADA